MLRDELRIIADEPLATDRKTTKTLRFSDTRILQQRQTAPARADEDKLRAAHPDLASREIFCADFPPLILAL